MTRATRRGLLLGVALPAVAYVVVKTYLLVPPASPFDRLGLDPASINPDTLSPQMARELGLISNVPTTEYIILVISSSTCLASSTRGFDDAVRRIPELAREQLTGQPEAVARTIGVALDQDPGQGVKYLSTLGEFDELVAGGGWLNTATEKYLWGVHALDALTPQVVLLRRRVRYLDGRPVVEGETVTRAINGAVDVMDWVSEGAPLRNLEADEPRVF